MAYKKNINPGKKEPKVGKKTKIKKSKGEEQDLWVEFDKDEDANTCDVDALDTEVNQPGETDDSKLPYADEEDKPITWLNSFQVKKGNAFLKKEDKVWYSVLFKKADVIDSSGKYFPFVYHDGQNLHSIEADDNPEDTTQGRIRLDVGDPSVGIIKPG